MGDEIKIPEATHGMLPDVAVLMQRVQQGLLWRGYRYLGVDTASWPLCDVFMEDGEHLLLVALWHPEREIALRQLWQKLHAEDNDIGLLLLGVEPVNSGIVRAFFDTLPGAHAYVAANSRLFFTHGDVSRIAILTDDGLTALLSPEDDNIVGRIDCRAAQQSAMMQQRAPRPLLTYGLMACCILIFIAMLSTTGLGGLGGIPNKTLVAWGGLFVPLVEYGQWWRVVSMAFLHGSGLHLAMNMAAMYAFMSPLEVWQGRGRLGIAYLVSIIAGSLGSLVNLFWWHSDTVSVGASGGLFGMLGFMAAIYVRHRDTMPSRMRTELFKWLKSILFYNLIFSLLPGIDMAAHLGGLIGGFITGLILAAAPNGVPSRRLG